jgi:integrase
MPKRSALLTDKLVANLKREDKAYLYWDDRGLKSGLAVCVYPSGAKTWFSYYTYGKGRMGSQKIGNVNTMAVAQARKKSIEVRTKVAEGKDPRGDDPTKSLSWSELLDEWHTKKQEGKKSGDDTLSFMKRHTSPWLQRPAAAIHTREIDSLIHKVKTVGTPNRRGMRRPTPGSALRLHTHLVTIFAWAVRTAQVGFVKNPMNGVDPPGEAKKRDKPWYKGEAADEVIKRVWAAADTLDRDDQLFAKLILLVPKRRNAIQAMRWEQINDKWLWKPIPGSRNKKNLDCTLPDFARRVMGAKQEEGPVMNISVGRLQTLMVEMRKLTGVDDWHWHGTRHILGTKLEEDPEDHGLGVEPHIARLVLDHPAATDVHAGYVHATYRKPVADALEKWARYVEALVTPAAGVAVMR